MVRKAHPPAVPDKQSGIYQLVGRTEKEHQLLGDATLLYCSQGTVTELSEANFRFLIPGADDLSGGVGDYIGLYLSKLAIVWALQQIVEAYHLHPATELELQDDFRCRERLRFKLAVRKLLTERNLPVGDVFEGLDNERLRLGLQ